MTDDSNQTTNPYYGIRFLIIEEAPGNDIVLEEYDIPPGQANDMRKNLQEEIENLRSMNPNKSYRLKEETINDGNQEI